jgi:hypothetical protein
LKIRHCFGCVKQDKNIVAKVFSKIPEEKAALRYQLAKSCFENNFYRFDFIRLIKNYKERIDFTLWLQSIRFNREEGNQDIFELVEKSKDPNRHDFGYLAENKMTYLYFVLEGEFEYVLGNFPYASFGPDKDGKTAIFGFEDYIYKMEDEQRDLLLDRESFFSNTVIKVWPNRQFSVRLKSEKAYIYKFNLLKWLDVMQTDFKSIADEFFFCQVETLRFVLYHKLLYMQ